MHFSKGQVYGEDAPSPGPFFLAILKLLPGVYLFFEAILPLSLLPPEVLLGLLLDNLNIHKDLLLVFILGLGAFLALLAPGPGGQWPHLPLLDPLIKPLGIFRNDVLDAVVDRGGFVAVLRDQFVQGLLGVFLRLVGDVHLHLFLLQLQVGFAVLS